MKRILLLLVSCLVILGAWAVPAQARVMDDAVQIVVNGKPYFGEWAFVGDRPYVCIEAFGQALGVHRKCLDAYLHLGDLEMARGRHRKALGIWRKAVQKSELARYQQDHIVLSSRLMAGQPVIHVLSDVRPEEGFETIAPNLEDVYFGRLRAQAADAAVAA